MEELFDARKRIVKDWQGLYAPQVRPLHGPGASESLRRRAWSEGRVPSWREDDHVDAWVLEGWVHQTTHPGITMYGACTVFYASHCL